MNNKIATLHPRLRDEAQMLLEKANIVLTGRADMLIVSCFRTNAEQDTLYLKRPKVTNAKGGQSIHNYGLAIDFALIIDGKTASWKDLQDFDGDKVADWMEIVKIFEDAGWEWGGRWKGFIDKPHLQKTFGYSWKQLKNMKKDNNGYVIL